MAQIELLMPKMGESVAEATIIKWLKEEGDQIEAEESVLEIATDKVDSEIPAPEDGVLVKKLFNEGDVVAVGQPIAIISTDGEAVAETPETPAQENIQPAAANDTAQTAVAAPQTSEKIAKTSESGRFYSPLVRSIAEKEGISAQELETIPGTGQGGRVTKKDILAYLENRKNQPATAPQPAQTATNGSSAATAHAAPAKTAEVKKQIVPLMEGDEIIEMDRMRKLIAEHMVMSKHTSPHVTSFVEADMTNIVLWRNKVKKAFLEREDEKITFTPIIIEAIVKAIKDFPMINVSVDGENIIKRKHINIGMATALPNGNLIVPVIKDADQLNLVGLTKKVNDLAKRARENKLQPDEIQGGTYTVTNVGTFGNVMGTPVINQPQVAIMAAGAIQKKPAVIETPEGDFIGIRHKMFLSHSYDHRVVDGSLGGQFVRRVADYLENFDINREF
tara:strand:- start:6110 stop:7453 length:1344 start_codon:yes stop_codon:yes gene_type:complete